MEILCEGCGKPITGGGRIRAGKAWHEPCLYKTDFKAREIDVKNLLNIIGDEVDYDTLFDVYRFCVEEKKMEFNDLVKKLQEGWVLITRGLENNGYGSIGVKFFRNKDDVSKFLATTIKESLWKDEGFWVEYIISYGVTYGTGSDLRVFVNF